MGRQMDGQRDGQGWSCLNRISIAQVKTYGTAGTASRGEEKKKGNRKKEKRNRKKKIIIKINVEDPNKVSRMI